MAIYSSDCNSLKDEVDPNFYDPIGETITYVFFGQNHLCWYMQGMNNYCANLDKMVQWVDYI